MTDPAQDEPGSGDDAPVGHTDPHGEADVGSETMAQRAMREFLHDREESARRRLAESESGQYPDLDRRFGESLRGVAEQGDPWPAVLRSVFDGLEPAIRARGPHVGAVDKLEFVLTDDIGISSRYRAFPDGSGLVEIYEGLVATMDLLSRPVAESLSRMTTSPVAMLRGARAVQRGENVDEVDLAVRLVLIRYSMIHRMILGTAGSLDYRLDERGRSMLDVLHHCGIEFALAHEVAHHLLGHTARPRGDAAVADGAACTDDREREFAADALAYEITSRSAAGPLMSAIGAYFVFTATDYSARALFVRTGITHPPSADRRSRILRQMGRRQRQAFGALTAHIEAAIDIALDLRSAVSASYWRTAYEAPAVCTEPHSERYFASLCSLDQILCAPLERCEWMLGHFDGRFGTRLASALPAIREHRPGDALRAWGLTESRVAELLNPQLALTFDALRAAIHTKLSNPAYTSADRRVLALTMARLVAPTLNRKT